MTSKRVSQSKKLTVQKMLFCTEYLKDRNGTQAAIRAGYRAKTAASQAERLLRNVDIQEVIASQLEKIMQRTELSVEKVLREIARLAFFDVRKLFNEDGSPKSILELDDDTAACVSGVEVVEEFENNGGERVQVGFVKKYKTSDKNSALDKAMKHLGLYEQDNKQKPAENSVRVVIVPAKENAQIEVRKIDNTSDAK